ncbi:MAG: zf-HC2 domain-containing protein [Bryobacteraceae bacterium]|nr:zf-HC2 domain-containing protein [Bryobacteraceae bacterium]
MTRLSRELDADVSPENLAEMDRHIQGCAPCVEYLESVKKSIELCKAHLPVDQPRPLDSATRNELRAAWQRVMAARKTPHQL